MYLYKINAKISNVLKIDFLDQIMNINLKCVLKR